MAPRECTPWSGARIYVPADQLDDETRRALGIDGGTGFRTKPQLAQDILASMIADGSMPPWAAGDEVYGRADELREFLAGSDTGYVMRVGCAFHTEVAPGVKIRADELVARIHQESWQVRSVTGSKGERAYAWAWTSTSLSTTFSAGAPAPHHR